MNIDVGASLCCGSELMLAIFSAAKPYREHKLAPTNEKTFGDSF